MRDCGRGCNGPSPSTPRLDWSKGWSPQLHLPGCVSQRPLYVCAVTRRRFPVVRAPPGKAAAGSNRSSHGSDEMAGGLCHGNGSALRSASKMVDGHLNLAGSGLHDSGDAGAGTDLRSRPFTGTLRLLESPRRHPLWKRRGVSLARLGKPPLYASALRGPVRRTISSMSQRRMPISHSS